MTYYQAKLLSRSLAAQPNSPANQLLDALCAESGRSRAGVLMQTGNPATWGGKMPVVTASKKWSPTGKPITLQHIDTTAKVTAPSGKDMAKLLGFDLADPASVICDIRKGRRAHFRGWYLPEVLAKQLTLKDVYGNETTLTMRDWVKTYGKSPGSFQALLDGRKTQISSHGVALASAPIEGFLAPRATTVSRVVMTDGKRTLRSRSIREAAAKIGVHASQLYPVAYGLTPRANGFRIKSLEVTKKAALVPVES